MLHQECKKRIEAPSGALFTWIISKPPFIAGKSIGGWYYRINKQVSLSMKSDRGGIQKGPKWTRVNFQNYIPSACVVFSFFSEEELLKHHSFSAKKLFLGILIKKLGATADTEHLAVIYLLCPGISNLFLQDYSIKQNGRSRFLEISQNALSQERT